MRPVRGLLHACHPMPCVAVTAFVVAFARSAGLPWSRAGVLAAAVVSGQLSVGWWNDYVDRERDLVAGRMDKPIPRGDVPAGVVAVGAVAALAACVPLSLALGARPGGAHLVAVASAWAYNAWLKFTRASFLPYLISFGLVPPVVVAWSLPDSPSPRWSIVAASGLLGMSAHFANTVGDMAVDAQTGVRGLPQRLGVRRSLAVSAALVAVAAGLLAVVARRTPVSLVALVSSAALAASCLGSTLSQRIAGTRLAFRLNVAAAALAVVAFVASGASPTLTTS